MIKTIIFDYDGVIVDSFLSVHEVHQTICQKIGKKCPTDFKEFKKAYGYSSRELYKNLGFSKKDGEKADLIFKEEILKKNSSAFEGIREVISSLSKKYNLVLLSSNSRREVVQKLKKFGLIDKFKLIFAADKSGPLKKSEAIPEILEKTKSKSDEIIMIADRTIDYDIGVRSGLSPNRIILVDYGWGYDKNKIPKQKVIVNKPEDLLKAINVLKDG